MTQHDDETPPGTHDGRSAEATIEAQEPGGPVAPAEAAVDAPTETPDDAPDIAAPEAGVPSPSKS